MISYDIIQKEAVKFIEAVPEVWQVVNNLFQGQEFLYGLLCFLRRINLATIWELGTIKNYAQELKAEWCMLLHEDMFEPIIKMLSDCREVQDAMRNNEKKRNLKESMQNSQEQWPKRRRRE